MASMLCSNQQGDAAQPQRLRQLEEHCESLQAQVERLGQRVLALEAGVASAAPAPLPRQPAAAAAVAGDPVPEAEPPQQERPPQLPLAQEPGDESPVAESDVKLEVTAQEPAQPVSLRDQTVADVYTFQESMWDVQLFMGKLLGPADSILVAFYTAINILVQIFFCLIVWNMTDDTITDTTLADMLHWRLGNGHTFKNFDSATNTSLVRRVCDNFGANNVGATQQSNNVNFDAYMPKDGTFAVGPMLCGMAVLIWTVTVLIDLWSTESFLIAVISLKRRDGGGRATKMISAGDGRIRVENISNKRIIYAILCIVLPRVVIDILLLWGGIRFLVFENTLPGLILNAVALGFILGLDELVFQILPRRAQRIIEVVEPVEKHGSFVHPKTSLDLRSAFIFVSCVAICLASWFVYLDPKVAMIKEAQALLCGGDIDFVYSIDAGLGMVDVTSTAPRKYIQETHKILAVLQRTGLPLSSRLLEKYAQKVPAETLYEEVQWYELSEVDKRTRSDSLSSLECMDYDFDLAHARAMHSTYVGGYGDTATAGSFCANAAALSSCNGAVVGTYISKMCAHSCQCDGMVLYNRTNCNSRCHAYVEKEVHKAADQCTEPTYRGKISPELRGFSKNFLDYLVQEGMVEHTQFQNVTTRTTLTRQGLEALAKQTDGKYTMVDSEAFLLNWNLSFWMAADDTYLSTPDLNVQSPCEFVPFINRIFEVDLCASVTAGSVGTIRGFCPLACHQGRCSSTSLDPTATFDQLVQHQQGMGLTENKQILYPVLNCSVPQTVYAGNVLFFVQPLWSNGTFTVDHCDPALANYTTELVFSYSDTPGGVSMVAAGCNTTGQLDPRKRAFVFVRSDAPANTPFTATMHCHTDGALTCGSTVNASTVGAPNSRGGPAGERIYDIDVPDLSVVTFETCGSQLDAGLSVYDYPTSTANGGLYRSQDGTSSCGGANGSSLTVAMPMPTASQGLRLVVEGKNLSEGNFTVRTVCSYPRIQCGDVIRGDTSALRSSYGSAAPEVIWRFSTGSRGVNITIDTCNSTFDTDIRIMSLDMAQQLYFFDYGFENQEMVCGWKAHVTIPAAPNSDFNILLEGYLSLVGKFTMALQCTP